MGGHGQDTGGGGENIPQRDVEVRQREDHGPISQNIQFKKVSLRE